MRQQEQLSRNSTADLLKDDAAWVPPPSNRNPQPEKRRKSTRNKINRNKSVQRQINREEPIDVDQSNSKERSRSESPKGDPKRANFSIHTASNNEQGNFQGISPVVVDLENASGSKTTIRMPAPQLVLVEQQQEQSQQVPSD